MQHRVSLLVVSIALAACGGSPAPSPSPSAAPKAPATPAAPPTAPAATPPATPTPPAPAATATLVSLRDIAGCGIKPPANVPDWIELDIDQAKMGTAEEIDNPNVIGISSKAPARADELLTWANGLSCKLADGCRLGVAQDVVPGGVTLRLDVVQVCPAPELAALKHKVTGWTTGEDLGPEDRGGQHLALDFNAPELPTIKAAFERGPVGLEIPGRTAVLAMWKQDEHVPTRLDFALGDDAAAAKKLGEAVAGAPLEFTPPP